MAYFSLVSLICGALDQRAILMQFYDAAGGPSWGRNDGWLDGPPCNRSTNRWFGLICDNSSEVTQLLMYSNQLTGTLATQLGALPSLTQLFLPTDHVAASGNSLSGTLPTELGRLGRLTDLILDGNSLSGTVPTQLGSAAQLMSATLDGNSLSGVVPTQLGRLGTTLTYLGLDSNNISGTIPAQLERLSTLQWLNLDSNQRISGTIPAGLERLTSLQWLDLYRNAISGTLPSEIAALPLAADLRIHANRLSGTLPSQLGAVLADYCYLTNAQCVADTGGDPRLCADATTNRFACPLPPQLLAHAACGGRGLKCTSDAPTRAPRDRPEPDVLS